MIKVEHSVLLLMLLVSSTVIGIVSRMRNRKMLFVCDIEENEGKMEWVHCHIRFEGLAW